MLFTRAGAKPGMTVLIQGAGGGVATATIVLPGFATLAEEDPEEFVEPQIGRALNAGAGRRR